MQETRWEESKKGKKNSSRRFETRKPHWDGTTGLREVVRNFECNILQLTFNYEFALRMNAVSS